MKRRCRRRILPPPPPFEVVHVAYPKLWYGMSNPLYPSPLVIATPLSKLQ